MNRAYSLWTIQEEASLVAMKERGMKLRAIAEALGRSRNAVNSRLQERRRNTKPRGVVAVEYPTARVPKQLVIDWYEVGWRVLGISVTDCVMEWRLDRAPEYPHACKVEASTTTAPERVLEVA